MVWADGSRPRSNEDFLRKHRWLEGVKLVIIPTHSSCQINLHTRSLLTSTVFCSLDREIENAVSELSLEPTPPGTPSPVCVWPVPLLPEKNLRASKRVCTHPTCRPYKKIFQSPSLSPSFPLFFSSVRAVLSSHPIWCLLHRQVKKHRKGTGEGDSRAAPLRRLAEGYSVLPLWVFLRSRPPTVKFHHLFPLNYAADDDSPEVRDGGMVSTFPLRNPDFCLSGWFMMLIVLVLAPVLVGWDGMVCWCLRGR
jgi:hypothetical protein